VAPPENHEYHVHNNSGADGQPRLGLMLSGGGARGAYQDGVLKAVAEVAANLGINQPIKIITGVSAGAVNAAYLASRSQDFSVAADEMAMMWSQITANCVFKTDALSAGRSGLRFLSDATIGALYRKKLARSLLDTEPMRAFLDKKIPFDQINRNLKAGYFESLAITAMNYTNATSVTFVNSAPEAPMWQRSRRASELANIAKEHVMASAAIPLFFPPVKVGEDHFGDGCLRNMAPLSPAIHLGADRILVISARKPDSKLGPTGPDIDPSIARILGVILNALLLDSIDLDMERMSRVNSTIDFVTGNQRSGLSLRKVDFLWIRPSRDIGELAGDLFNRLPSVLRYLVAGLGSSREASELTSYLLFDPDFCGQLVHFGYEDGIKQKEDIEKFLTRGF
jgi:NTE family protein